MSTTFICTTHQWTSAYQRCPQCFAPPTEMTSLREIKGKLDAVLESQAKLWASHHEVCSQIGANNLAILERLTALDAALKGTADGLASEIGELRRDLELALRNFQPKPKKRAKK